MESAQKPLYRDFEKIVTTSFRYISFYKISGLLFKKKLLYASAKAEIILKDAALLYRQLWHKTKCVFISCPNQMCGARKHFAFYYIFM